MSEDTLTAISDENPALTIEEVESLFAASQPTFEPLFPGDPNATWDYWSGLYNAPEGPSDDVVWARLRYRRNTLLAACDFRVVPDAPWNTAPWLAYRQALRDLPDNTADPRQAVWPVEP